MAAVRLLGVFAHPDDETFCCGGTLARHVAEGAEAMVVSFTPGQAGQIRDAAIATRRTLAEVRRRELEEACRRLGVPHARCLDHVDGTLRDEDRDLLRAEATALLDEFEPDVVFTFGNDGAYGHPDHVTISAVVTDACRAWRPVRLFHSHFPRSRMLMRDRLAGWLIQMSGRFRGTLEFVQAMSIFAQETAALGYAGDFVDVTWHPTGTYVIEQGEAATALHLILSGRAEVFEEDPDGSRRRVSERGPGEFVGEIGVAYGTPRTAHVIAAENVTCLTFAFARPAAFAGRGTGARLAEAGGAVDEETVRETEMTGATTCIDVRGWVDRKVAALAAHRTQYPIDPAMFPTGMLEEMFGREWFVRMLPPVELGTTLLA